MQALLADLGITLPKLGPDVREQAGGGHEDLRGIGELGRETTPAGPEKQQSTPDGRNAIDQGGRCVNGTSPPVPAWPASAHRRPPARAIPANVRSTSAG